MYYVDILASVFSAEANLHRYYIKDRQPAAEIIAEHGWFLIYSQRSSNPLI
jgi:hypothetical protein